jgi:predicted XRE-type DNA-binding protein
MMEQRFASVWDALEASPAETINMKARADLMVAIRNVVDQWDMKQAEAAKRLGMTQPRMNDLLRGRIEKFSLDTLLNIATSAGLKVEWRVTQSAA